MTVKVTSKQLELIQELVGANHKRAILEYYGKWCADSKFAPLNEMSYNELATVLYGQYEVELSSADVIKNMHNHHKEMASRALKAGFSTGVVHGIEFVYNVLGKKIGDEL